MPLLAGQVCAARERKAHPTGTRTGRMDEDDGKVIGQSAFGTGFISFHGISSAACTAAKCRDGETNDASPQSSLGRYTL